MCSTSKDASGHEQRTCCLLMYLRIGMAKKFSIGRAMMDKGRLCGY